MRRSLLWSRRGRRWRMHRTTLSSRRRGQAPAVDRFVLLFEQAKACSTSEFVAQRELHHPRTAASAGLHSADNAGVGFVEEAIRQQKVRMVEDVEYLIPGL